MIGIVFSYSCQWILSFQRSQAYFYQKLSPSLTGRVSFLWSRLVCILYKVIFVRVLDIQIFNIVYMIPFMIDMVALNNKFKIHQILGISHGQVVSALWWTWFGFVDVKNDKNERFLCRFYHSARYANHSPPTQDQDHPAFYVLNSFGTTHLFLCSNNK